MLTQTLLDLPLEIRLIIYDLSLGDVRLAEYYIVHLPQGPQRRRMNHKSRSKGSGTLTVAAGAMWPSLLAVNRQIRKETFDLVLANATFRMACHHPNIILPDSVRPNVELVRCDFLDSCCRKDIYTFKNLRMLTCQVYFADSILRDYGYAPQNGPEAPFELADMVMFGLDSEHYWTLADAGYPLVMEVAENKDRWFSMRILANSSWWVSGPQCIKSTQATIDVDEELSTRAVSLSSLTATPWNSRAYSSFTRMSA